MERIIWSRRAYVATFLAAVSATSLATAQSSLFLGEDNHPKIVGSRSMSVGIQMASGEDTSKFSVHVVYGTSKEAVDRAGIDDQIATAKTELLRVDGGGIAYYKFYFPHKYHKSPNEKDKHQEIISSGTQVYYKWIKKDNQSSLSSKTIEFKMPNAFTIASFGDSFASGEGAPNSRSNPWGKSGKLCHRSKKSGQHLVVEELRKAHKETAFAFKNVACSGAQIYKGILDYQPKSDEEVPEKRAEPQLSQVRDWLKDRGYGRLNIALFSIGGNDVNFGPMVEEFFILPGDITSSDDKSKTARMNLAKELENLRERYSLLYTGISREDFGIEYDKIIVTGYPDPTRDRYGEFCRISLNYGSCWGPIELTNKRSEFAFAYNSFIRKLNNEIKTAVASFDDSRWGFVDGLTQLSKKHGICNCERPYFNTIGASESIQGDEFGTMHPNQLGHEKIYRAALTDPVERAYKRIILDESIDNARERARRKAQARLSAIRWESVLRTQKALSQVGSSSKDQLKSYVRQQLGPIPTSAGAESDSGTDDETGAEDDE